MRRTTVPMIKPRNISILRTSIAGVLQRFAQLLSSLITLPLALHCLGVAGFGIWGAATSLAWLSGLLALGFGSALVTLIPRGLAAGHTMENRGYVTAALYGGATLSAVLLLAGLAVILLSGMKLPSGPFLVASVALTLNIPLSVGFELWLALHKGHIGAFWAAVQTLLGLLFVVIGALAGAGVTIMTLAIYGALIVANAGSMAHALYVHPHLRPLPRLPAAALRTMLTQGSLLFAVTVAVACSTSFDNVMTLAWLGPDASAQMAVAIRVCVTAGGLVGAVTQPFWPSFADALAANDHGWARRMLLAGMAAVIILSVSGSGLIIVFGTPALHWWLRQDLHLPPALFWAMAIWIVSMTLTNVPGSVLHAALKLRVQIVILSAAALAGFGIKYLVAKPCGVTGVLLVTPVLWFVAVGPIYLWLAWRTVTRPD